MEVEFRRLGAACFAALTCMTTGAAFAADGGAARPPTMADVVKAAKPSDWHALDPANTLYLDLKAGRVVIELAPAFAPNHIANIKALVREGYFDGLAIVRVQDNYVAQWGDPYADARRGEANQPRPIKTARRAIKAEFSVSPGGDKLPFVRLPDVDGWAAQSGFSGDFPSARDPALGQAWLAHCYGTVGVGRDLDADSGSGAEMYAVIGQAPRWLERNITAVGRVVQGMELLSSLPRGGANMGFYDKPEQRVKIERVRLAADVPAAERTNLEIMRTDTPTFAALIESRRNRIDEFYKVPLGHIDVCGVPIPVRASGK